MEHVTSPNNPSLKLARKLLSSARERRRTGQILLDGLHLLSGYSEHFGLTDAVVLVSTSSVNDPEIDELINRLPADAKVLEVSDALFTDISPVKTPTGIIALAERPQVTSRAVQSRFVLALDGIQDPGNLGSILRTAAATKVDGVLLSTSCADAWSPKCLRGGMGAQFVLPVKERIELQTTLPDFPGACIATSAHSGESLVDTDLSGPVMMLLGGEGAGLSADLLTHADQTVHIPLDKSIESLNVGAAVAMICYEHLRQSLT